MVILAFRNLAHNIMCAPGHHKGKVALGWMSNKQAPNLPWLFQSSQEGSTALEPQNERESTTNMRNEVPLLLWPILLLSDVPLWLSTDSAYQLQVPWSPQEGCSLGFSRFQGTARVCLPSGFSCDD